MLRIPILVACATILALSAVPAQATPASHARDRCAPGPTERVRARSASAVVLVRRRRVLIGCSTATGHRRVMSVIDPGGDYPSTFEQVHLYGTTVAYVVPNGDRYGSAQWLYRDDAVHAHRRKLLDTGFTTNVAVGPAAVIAYVTGGAPSQQLLLDRPGTATLLVDQGGTLRSVRFTPAGLLSWQHKTTPMTASITAPDYCTNGTNGGTLALALTHTRTSATACWRATGTARTLAADQITQIALGGSWLAIATSDGQILTTDTLTDTSETIPAPNVDALAIDAHGSTAWTTPGNPGPRQVWAHDATGTHQLGANDNTIYFGFDQSTLYWGPNTTTLQP
jgi:hypothetical protein